ncbi:hypothetical protein Emed_002231 [Eimeria media]
MAQQFLYLCRFPYLDLTPSSDEPLVNLHGEEVGPLGAPPLDVQGAPHQGSGAPPRFKGKTEDYHKLVGFLQSRLHSPNIFAVSERGSAVAVAFALNGCPHCGCWCSSSSSNSSSSGGAGAPEEGRHVPKRRKLRGPEWGSGGAPSRHDSSDSGPVLTEAEGEAAAGSAAAAAAAAVDAAASHADSAATTAAAAAARGLSSRLASCCSKGRHICVFVIDALTRRVVSAWRLKGAPAEGPPPLSKVSEAGGPQDDAVSCKACGGPLSASAMRGPTSGLSCMHFTANDSFLCFKDDLTGLFWLLDLQQQQQQQQPLPRWWQPREALVAARFAVLPAATAASAAAAAGVGVAAATLDASEAPSRASPGPLAERGPPQQEGPPSTFNLLLLHAEANVGAATSTADRSAASAYCSSSGYCSAAPVTLAFQHSECSSCSSDSSGSSCCCGCMQLLPPLAGAAPWTYTLTAALQREGRSPLLLYGNTGEASQQQQQPQQHEQQQQQQQSSAGEQAAGLKQQQPTQPAQEETVSAACVCFRPAAAAAAAGLQQLWGCGLRFLAWPPLAGAAAAAGGGPLAAAAASDPSDVLIRRSTAANVQAAAAAERIAAACCIGAAAIQQQQQQQQQRLADAPPAAPGSVQSSGAATVAATRSAGSSSSSNSSNSNSSSSNSAAGDFRKLLLRAALPLSRPAAPSLRVLLGQQLALHQLRGYYRRLLQLAPQTDRPLLLQPEAAAAADTTLPCGGSSKCSACRSKHATQQWLVAVHTQDDRLLLQRIKNSSSSNSNGSSSSEGVCTLDFNAVPPTELSVAAAAALGTFCKGSCSRGPSAGGGSRAPRSSVLATHCDGHGLHVLLQLHAGGLGLAWLVYRQQQQLQRVKGKPQQQQQQQQQQYGWSVQAAARIQGTPRLSFAAFGRETCGVKPLACAATEASSSRSSTCSSSSSCCCFYVDLMMPLHADCRCVSAGVSFSLVAPVSFQHCQQQQQQHQRTQQVRLCLRVPLQLAFWPPFNALILQQRPRSDSSSSSSNSSSSSGSADLLGAAAAAEAREAGGLGARLRVLLPQWGRCGDRASVRDFCLSDCLLEVQQPTQNSAEDLQGCSGHLFRKFRNEVWRPSWLRAADCLLRSRAHFVLRLRGPPEAVRGAPSQSALQGGPPRSPLVLLPVCSPLLMGPQTYSAAEEPQHQQMQPRWEETVWQQQQQQQQQRRGPIQTAAEIEEVPTASLKRGAPADSKGGDLGAPLTAPLGVEEETEELWNLKQGRLRLRDELFGCTDTASSPSSSCSISSSSIKEGWFGEKRWTVRALGPPPFAAWMAAVLSATELN